MNEFFSLRKKTGKIRLKTYLDYPCGMLSLILAIVERHKSPSVVSTEMKPV